MTLIAEVVVEVAIQRAGAVNTSHGQWTPRLLAELRASQVVRCLVIVGEKMAEAELVSRPAVMS